MGFHRIMTRTILGKLISRKSNDKVSRKCKKPHIGCAIWDHLSCELKCLSFLLYFSFYTIFGDTATLERPPRITPYGKFGRFVFLFWLLHAKNKCDTVIPSRDICAQRILKSNWLKAFLAIIQEQFPQI